MATEGGVLGVIRAARPQLRSPHDRVAFAIHAAFLSAGYSLTAVGSRVAPDLPASDAETAEVGIEGWNDMADAYSFQYSGAGQQGLSKSVLLKCLPMDDTLMVAVTDRNDKEALQFEVRVSDYVTTSEGTNYGQLYKNLNELVEQVNSCLLSKLKDNSSISSATTKNSKDSGSVRDERPSSVLLDEPAPSMYGLRYPPIPGFGNSDLLPAGGAGVYPTSVDPGTGGMLLGPNDPRWADMGYGDRSSLLEGGRGVIPPGARYDPIGPSGVPGFEPERFTRTRRPPGSSPHPDLEHFRPF